MSDLSTSCAVKTRFSLREAKGSWHDQAFYAVQGVRIRVSLLTGCGRIYFGYQKDMGIYVDRTSKGADHFHSPRCTGRLPF